MSLSFTIKKSDVKEALAESGALRLELKDWCPSNKEGFLSEGALNCMRKHVQAIANILDNIIHTGISSE